jgi:hypothetical protein
LLLFILAAYTLGAQNLTREQYIKKYKDIAIRQMYRHNIPASIILAQACLESSDGNSTLAKKANNHFGIKCHDGWKGKKIRQDDDARRECFRKYKNAEDSFTDHSNFLCSRTRYASLFDLPLTDYKAWAHGLKAAGYATNPKYAQLLINIIEEHELYKYDSKQKYSEKYSSNFAQRRAERLKSRMERLNRKAEKANLRANRASYKYHKFTHFEELQDAFAPAPSVVAPEQSVEGNKVHKQPENPKHNQLQDKSFYLVRKGDTLYSIARKYGLSVEEIQKLNPGIKANELKIGSCLKLK